MQGLILLNKPSGITSYSAVAGIKRLSHEKRVGHTGTLDPMATGVLPILLGRATALSSLLLEADKAYTAKIRLGISTDTDDITGNIISNLPVNVTDVQLAEALTRFTGKLRQRPPAYSALKRDGVPMYKLARRGEQTEIPEREIEVLKLTLLSGLDGGTDFTVSATVSKGTYIRSLARDIGEYLGCGACLSALERTCASGFDISECVSAASLTEETLSDYILNEETAVLHLREVCVTEKQAVRFCNGGKLDFERLKIGNIADGELFRVKFGGLFLGVGIAEVASSQLAVRCVINYPKAVSE